MTDVCTQKQLRDPERAPAPAPVTSNGDFIANARSRRNKAVAPYALATGLLAALYALLLALPVPTMFLALAPGGIAEMALTGKVLGLDAALITGFQLVRILMVTLGAAMACRMFERLVSQS